MGIYDIAITPEGILKSAFPGCTGTNYDVCAVLEASQLSLDEKCRFCRSVSSDDIENITRAFLGGKSSGAAFLTHFIHERLQAAEPVPA